MISQVSVRPIFFDLEVDRVPEKGGLEASIIQFAAYDPTRSSVEASFSEYLEIEPHFKVKKGPLQLPPGIITKKFKEVWPQFVSWCTKDRSENCRIVLIAHNAWNHDQKILKTECARIGQTLPNDWKVFDTLALANVALTNKMEKSLQALRDFYKIPSATAHVAKDDVETLYKVFSKMIEGVDATKVYEGMLDPHPVMTVASMIKTHRAAMPIIRGISETFHTEVCYYDTETTGLLNGPDPVKIVELSAFIPTRIGKDRFFSRLINPEMPIPIGAQNVHHISNEMVLRKEKRNPPFVPYGISSLVG